MRTADSGRSCGKARQIFVDEETNICFETQQIFAFEDKNISVRYYFRSVEVCNWQHKEMS